LFDVLLFLGAGLQCGIGLALSSRPGCSSEIGGRKSSRALPLYRLRYYG
jgi:hypothetical protein